MKKRIFSIIIIIALTLLITVGCGNNQKEVLRPDDELVAFLPANEENYIGDSGYFHVVENIERESLPDVERVYLTGEVKDNTTAHTNTDFDFEIILSVDSEKMVQTFSGSQLNESNFESLVLLKQPIEVGNTWTFNTQDIYGSKWKVTGEITAINDAEEEVVVKHSTKDGYYEERIIQKDRGVTDFLRLLVFKNESTITGYHMEKSAVTVTEITQEPVEDLKIPVAYYNLILGFEQSWADYVKAANEDIFQFLSEGSPAYEKIKAVSQDANTAIEFVRYYPFEISEIENGFAIKVVEIFMTNGDEPTENRVLYQVVLEKGIAKVYDFESID